MTLHGKVNVRFVVILVLLLITSCNSINELNNNLSHEEEKKSINEMDTKLLKKTSEIKDESTAHTENNKESKADFNYIEVEIPGSGKLKIEKERFNDDIYGTGQLDNKWTLEEIDMILHAVQGEWTIDSYEGFVAAQICLILII